MPSSLKKIQQDYVELVLSHFVEERKDFRGTEKVQLPPTLYVPERGKPRDLVEFKVAKFLDDLTSFWVQRWPELRIAVESTEGLTIAAWRDMDIENVLPKYCLYFDTIAVADPVFYVPNKAFAYRQAPRAFRPVLRQQRFPLFRSLKLIVNIPTCLTKPPIENSPRVCSPCSFKPHLPSHLSKGFRGRRTRIFRSVLTTKQPFQLSTSSS